MRHYQNIAFLVVRGAETGLVVFCAQIGYECVQAAADVLRGSTTMFIQLRLPFERTL